MLSLSQFAARSFCLMAAIKLFACVHSCAITLFPVTYLFATVSAPRGVKCIAVVERMQSTAGKSATGLKFQVSTWRKSLRRSKISETLPEICSLFITKLLISTRVYPANSKSMASTNLNQFN